MNKSIFASKKSEIKAPIANAVNNAGATAYEFTPEHALAQYAMTGTFNNTYYVDAKSQIDEVKNLLTKVDDLSFIAKLAVYARQKGFMKDMPAFLLSYLATKDLDLLEKVFV